jgi:hypothetical protein
MTYTAWDAPNFQSFLSALFYEQRIRVNAFASRNGLTAELETGDVAVTREADR